MDICTVRLRHKDKIARIRFFVAPGDGQALLGMPDIELLNILQITGKEVRDQQADKKFDSRPMQSSNGSSCKANKGQQIKTDNVDVNYTSSNMSDCSRSNLNKAADKRASHVFMQKSHNGLNEFFFHELGLLKAYLAYM